MKDNSQKGTKRTKDRAGQAAATPLSILLPYQRDWVADDARFKIGLWARQTGKSFSTAAEAVTDCLQRKTTWVTLSAGERQALEWMLKAREWAEAYQIAIEDYVEERDQAEALMKSAEIRWGNGSRLIGIPANPSTARGYSANLTLDEFAFHENPDAIWRAIYPSISNPLKGIFKLRIVSTPNGMGNKFHDLWTKNVGGQNSKFQIPNSKEDPSAKLQNGAVYSCHKIDIETAIARGLPLNLEELRAGLDDPDGWAQEYLCEFMDAAAVLLPYELIAKCESPEATVAIAPEYYTGTLGTSSLPVFIGWDFARKKDLSVPWVVERVGDVLHTREVVEFRGMSTPDQITNMRHRIGKARRVSVDYTGPGVGLGDYLVKEFGEWNPDQHQFGKIELCTFTNALKVDIFSKLRMAFESAKVRVPVSREVREDLHSMQRVSGATGNVTYRAPHTEDGHADRCTALALAVRAAGQGNAGAILSVEGIRTGANRAGVNRASFEPRRMQRA